MRADSSVTSRHDPRASVWVIEDSARYRETVSTLIERSERLRCTRVFGDCESALTVLDDGQELPRLILMDLGLPGMSGFEVARAFRTEPGLSRIFLIALSGYAQPQDVAKAKEAGFEAHLAKPFRVETLLKLIESAPSIP